MSDALPVVRADRMPLIAAGALSVVTFVVGSIGIGRSFNYDEGVTYAMFVNGGSITRALTEQVVFNNHQMFSVTQTIAWRVGLVGESSQRVLPVLCGVATVGLLTWWLARRVSVLAGVAAGVVLLLNPVYLPEFRSLRGYSLSTLAVLVAVIVTHHSWRDHRRRWLVIAAASMVIAVTSHAYAAVGLAMLAVVTLAMGRLRVAHLISWLAAASVAFVIQLPLLDDARRSAEARGSVYKPAFVRLTAEFYLGRRGLVVVLCAALAAVGLLAIARRSARHAAAVAGAVAVLVGVVLLLWQVLQPADLFARFFVSLTPFLAASIGVGAASLPRRFGVVPIVIIAVMLAPNARRVLDQDPPIRRAAAVVETARADGRAVCGAFTTPLLVYASPVPWVDVSTVDGYGECDVFVAVLGIGDVGRATADQRFERRISAGGGLFVYTDAAYAPTVEAQL